PPRCGPREHPSCHARIALAPPFFGQITRAHRRRAVDRSMVERRSLPPAGGSCDPFPREVTLDPTLPAAVGLLLLGAIALPLAGGAVLVRLVGGFSGVRLVATRTGRQGIMRQADPPRDKAEELATKLNALAIELFPEGLHKKAEIAGLLEPVPSAKPSSGSV